MAIRIVRFPWDPRGFQWYQLSRDHKLGIRHIDGGIVVQWSAWSLYLTWRAS